MAKLYAVLPTGILLFNSLSAPEVNNTFNFFVRLRLGLIFVNPLTVRRLERQPVFLLNVWSLFLGYRDQDAGLKFSRLLPISQLL